MTWVTYLTSVSINIQLNFVRRVQQFSNLNFLYEIKWLPIFDGITICKARAHGSPADIVSITIRAHFRIVPLDIY